MKLYSRATFSGCLLSVCTAAITLVPYPANAQFDQLLKSIQKNLPQQPAQSGSGGMSKRRTGIASADEWCRSVSGALGDRKVDTSLISSEFNLPNLDGLQESFFNAFEQRQINRTFPNADYFRFIFETKSVNGIYNSFLSFPEPETLAALIQMSRGSDPQERSDAQMALVFLHLQASKLSKYPTRWKDLHSDALRNPNIPAYVFRARLLTYGELAKRNFPQARTDLVEAGNLETKLRDPNENIPHLGGNRPEFDPNNFMIVHKQTARDLKRFDPNPAPDPRTAGITKAFGIDKILDQTAAYADRIEVMQANYANKFPKTRHGKLAADVSRLNQESIEIGAQIIKRSQGGNQLVGQIESMKSLKSQKLGDKQLFVSTNPEVEAATLKMVSSVGSLDNEQKKLLIQAQEKRYLAQGVIHQTQAEIVAEIAQGLVRGQIDAAATPVEAVKQFTSALVQSCLITAKWEQAMRAKDVQVVDKAKSATEVGALASKYKDD